MASGDGSLDLSGDLAARDLERVFNPDRKDHHWGQQAGEGSIIVRYGRDILHAQWVSGLAAARPWGTCPLLGSFQSGLRKEILGHVSPPVDSRLSALCLLPDRASADTLKPHESVASEISSRQRCACTWRRPTRIIHYKRYRSVRADYPIGFDPLPYRFGYFPEPYRYHDRVAVLTVRPAGYRSWR